MTAPTPGFRRAPRGATPGPLCAPPFGRRAWDLCWTPRAAPGHDALDVRLDRSSALAPDARRRAEALLAAIGAARVGGAFWGASPAPRPQCALVRAHTPDGLAALLHALRREREPGDLLLSLPGAAWARRARPRLERSGFGVWCGPLDAWPVLEVAREVVLQRADDRLAAPALAACVPVRVLRRSEAEPARLAPGLGSSSGRDSADAAQAAHALLIEGVVYRDPFTGGPLSAEAAVALLADWRRGAAKARLAGACAGISRWKRRAVAAMLDDGGRRPRFADGAAAAVRLARRRHTGVAVWSSRAPPGLDATARRAGVSLLHMEDGFIRSRGLGSDLVPPNSIVVDGLGPHVDPRGPSELERLLAETAFDADLLRRAEALILALRRLGLTKYNLGGVPPPLLPAGRRRVLVVGQVEDDLSLRLGGAGVGGALDLLRRARAHEPNATIVFKPHPDVEAGHRRGRVSDREALAFADVVAPAAALAPLLDQVDAVHVATSLTGFEALLRGREVTAHGQPFYAGWGLTRDLAPPPRRTRRLTLPELVAGALILYPLYLDPVTQAPCPPEVLVARLAQAPRDASPLTLLWRWGGRLRAAAAGRGRLAERPA